MALLETLKDDFATTFNTGLWTRTNSTQVVQANRTLSLSTTASAAYFSIDSVATYDLTASSVYIQLVNAGIRTIASHEISILVLIKDSSNTMQWYLNSTTLQCYKKVATVNTQVGSNLTYNPAVHRYFRIRESGGTTFYDWSTDGEVWTNHTSVANPFVVTSLQLEISSGTYAAETSVTTVVFDNSNIYPTGSKPFNFPNVKVGDGMSRNESAT